MDHSLEGSIGVGIVKVLGFFLPSIILEELRVSDGVNVDMPGGLRSGSLVEGIVMGGVSSMGEIQIF